MSRLPNWTLWTFIWLCVGISLAAICWYGLGVLTQLT